MPESHAATCPDCGHDAHTPRYCVMLTDDCRPCACGEPDAASPHRSPFRVGDRVIRKYDGKVGEVDGIDVKGRLSVTFKDGTHSILPALPHTYQKATR